MGEMTIRNLDEALLLALQQRADLLGTDAEKLAADIVRAGVGERQGDRGLVADAIRARTQPTPISSVALMDQIRDEGL